MTAAFLISLSAAVIVVLWLDNMRARERAVQLARAACRRADLQLLDDTVVLSGWGLLWRHRPRIRRLYRFEYTDVGETRRPGHLVLVGDMPEGLELGLDQGPGVGG